MPPGLDNTGHIEKQLEKNETLKKVSDSMDCLVQLLQSGLVDDADGEFEYKDAAGNLQVSNWSNMLPFSCTTTTTTAAAAAATAAMLRALLLET